MGEKLVIGPHTKGLQTNVTAFNIDNEAFPNIVNAYQWRGRVKRKRGTALLNRLRRYFNSNNVSYTPGGSVPYLITLSGGAGNLLSGTYSNGTLSFSLQTNGNIVPGSVVIVDTSTAITYTDPAMDGTLSGGTGGTINYATGAITINGGGADTIRAAFLYYPDLPVMGLEDLVLSAQQFPATLGFDTVYSYNITTTVPYSIYDVSFYKNPPTGTYAGYVQKANPTNTSWNGQDYQQFYTTNYQNALWATNGINVPFAATNIGMQFKPIVTTTIVAAGPPALVTLQITGHGLVVGDFVFINEVATTTGINLQTGYVVTVTDANNVIVELPNATIANNGAGGIAQYLTSRSDVTKDSLRWYDGDPTDGNATSPTLNGRKGWVNFAPPLSIGAFTIDDLPPAIYYLVGARMIVPYKDRLLFIGPVIQTSTGAPKYLQDAIIYSQNGTPYYTASFAYSTVIYSFSAATVFNPILVPDNQTGQPTAYWEDQTGFGGNIEAGFSQPILSVGFNEDVLILGFSNRQVRLVYTSNEFIPFNFYTINSELGSGSTFSSVTLDRGVLTVGDHGIVMTAQVSSQRIDLDIPDAVFEINLNTNGPQRVTAQRDFINEWVYFTYPSNQWSWRFPNQTLQYNYRDQTWGLFDEVYTTYGQFRRSSGYTWATIGMIFPTWSSWNQPWSAGSSTLLQPEVIAGNQQGFVLVRDEGTNEGNSLYIQSISGAVVTSPDHCLNNGDFITISGAIGTNVSAINGQVFQILTAVSTPNTFTLVPAPSLAVTYVGGGVIKRMYRPFIQSKQFPVSWGFARKTRLGPQQYLLTTTNAGQITLYIFLSQDGNTPYNAGPIVPANNVQNPSLVYSTVLYTCPEATNLGLTPANVNLQQLESPASESQIWHRVNTSLIGDTVQVGFTLSNDQMLDPNLYLQFAEIELHGIVLDVQPSSVLA